MILAPRRELVLVGGGHAHVQVLLLLAMDPPLRTRVTVVVDTPLAVYSGMVPGFVAGQYRLDELEIDEEALDRDSGIPSPPDNARTAKFLTTRSAPGAFFLIEGAEGGSPWACHET